MNAFDLYSLLGESKEELKDWENRLGSRELGGIYTVIINKYWSSFLFVPSSIASVLPPVVKLVQWSSGFVNFKVVYKLILDDFLYIDLNFDIYENYFLFSVLSDNATDIVGNYVIIF